MLNALFFPPFFETSVDSKAPPVQCWFKEVHSCWLNYEVISVTLLRRSVTELQVVASKRNTWRGGIVLRIKKCRGDNYKSVLLGRCGVQSLSSSKRRAVCFRVSFRNSIRVRRCCVHGQFENWCANWSAFCTHSTRSGSIQLVSNLNGFLSNNRSKKQ